MTKKEIVVQEPYELTATPISWLEPMGKDELSAIDDILIVVSKPDYQVQDTHYISKKLQLSELKDSLASSLSIDIALGRIDSISSTVSEIVDLSNDLTAVVPGEVKLSAADGTDIKLDDPYVISAISFEDGNLTGLSGYSFKEALSAANSSSTFQRLNAASLSATTEILLNGKHIMPVEAATSATAGVVKVYAPGENPPTELSKAFVQKDPHERLYVSVSQFENAIAHELSAAVLSELKAWISKSYCKTKIVQTDKGLYETDTLYFIADGHIDKYAVTLTYDSEKTDAAAYVDGMMIPNGSSVQDSRQVIVVSMPKEGYEYSAAQSGWQLNNNGSIQNSYVVEGEPLPVIVPDPEAVQQLNQEDEQTL